jgi:leucyl/phenylalanyl-tRNA--protein transferase
MPDWGPVYVGGELTTANLIESYSRGIFPWPSDPDDPMEWHCPNPRAVLLFDEFHVPKSLKRTAKKHPYQFTVDKAFERVVRGCAEADRGPFNQSWIFEQVVDAYVNLHHDGFAHSVEAWEGTKLVGGLYGVSVGGVFTGESMFHLRSDASKLAVLYLVQYLSERGLNWIDIQVMTPHFERFGAVHISRTYFLRLMTWTQQQRLDLFPG